MKRVVIVGPPGSGKSTVIRLLIRLYDVTAGAVRLDGRDVREYDLSELRRRTRSIAALAERNGPSNVSPGTAVRAEAHPPSRIRQAATE